MVASIAAAMSAFSSVMSDTQILPENGAIARIRRRCPLRWNSASRFHAPLTPAARGRQRCNAASYPERCWATHARSRCRHRRPPAVSGPSCVPARATVPCVACSFDRAGPIFTMLQPCWRVPHAPTLRPRRPPRRDRAGRAVVRRFPDADRARTGPGTIRARRSAGCRWSSCSRPCCGAAEDGSYWLVTPAEQGLIEVEDVPFVAVELACEGSGPAQQLSLRTNLDEWVPSTRRIRSRCGPRRTERRRPTCASATRLMRECHARPFIIW